MFTPSPVVTEGQRVALTCSTSCPLTGSTVYIWFFNGRPLTLPDNQNKHLVLDPVSGEHAGNYSCAIKAHKTSSSEEALRVQGSPFISKLYFLQVCSTTNTNLLSPAPDKLMAVVNVIRLIVVLLIPVPLLLFHLWLR